MSCLREVARRCALLVRYHTTWRGLASCTATLTEPSTDVWGVENTADDERKDKAFVDRRRVVITAGNGGSGAVSFMKDGGAKRRRGADGGNGGNGGDVWIELPLAVADAGGASIWRGRSRATRV